MSDAQTLLIASQIQDSSIARRTVGLINDLLATQRLTRILPVYEIKACTCDDGDAIIKLVRDHFDKRSSGKRTKRNRQSPNGAILLSDVIEDPDVPETHGWIRELLDTCIGYPLVTVGINTDGHRVPDIDRVLANDFSDRGFSAAIQESCQQVCYLTPPKKRELTVEPEIRQITRTYELADSFSLRHNVYRTMGYLEERVAKAKSKMEVEWSDGRSNHVGAFAQRKGQRSTLVGTTRVITTDQQASKFSKAAKELAERDPNLKIHWNKTVLANYLPILQSMDIPASFDIIAAIAAEDLVCGELSRVVVAKEFRGTGTSRRLVDRAIEIAIQKGAQRLFLECLKIHIPLYETFGFETFDMEGRVVGVGKTMVAMRLEFP